MRVPVDGGGGGAARRAPSRFPPPLTSTVWDDFCSDPRGRVDVGGGFCSGQKLGAD